ncbi:MAG: DoxX family protein, partial [Segetibacter sp.]
SSKSKAFTITTHVARVVLGLIFFVLGLNKFLQFIPMPPPEGLAGEFMFGLSKAPYMFPLIGLIEVVAGVLLLSGRVVPFALLLLFPINLNIFLFHLAFAPEGMGMAIFIMAAHILLAVYYWQVYKPIFMIENAWKSKRS